MNEYFDPVDRLDLNRSGGAAHGRPQGGILDRKWCIEPSTGAEDPDKQFSKPEGHRNQQAASEQAAADQRLQSRCGSCGGAQQRWKVVGGYVHLCAAWPACGGVAFEAGRGAGVRRAGPPLQAGGPAALTSIV